MISEKTHNHIYCNYNTYDYVNARDVFAVKMLCCAGFGSVPEF